MPDRQQCARFRKSQKSAKNDNTPDCMQPPSCVPWVTLPPLGEVSRANFFQVTNPNRSNGCHRILGADFELGLSPSGHCDQLAIS